MKPPSLEQAKTAARGPEVAAQELQERKHEILSISLEW
jgi:hypothetical protein